MADTHIQVNADGTTATRKTELWPSRNDLKQAVLRSIFEQHNWKASRIENISGSHWKIETSCITYSWKINLYISSIRDESRQPDEYKMQLGNSYPDSNEPGWINLVLGIYTIFDGVNPVEYILSGYEISRYDFSTNPSLRGTRTAGLQKAKIFGMYTTEKSVLFRPEFIYFYIENQSAKGITTSRAKLANDACMNQKNEYLTALRTKPFLLLAGISGTGKSRIVRELAFKSCPSYLRDKDETTPGNYCMIEVKPNWHDSSELLGYYSNISKRFMFTKFVKFLVRAMMHPNVPFFVCLDEMNLAPVEQYFAEFLSVLETRKHSADEETTVVTGNLLKPEDFVFTEESGGLIRTKYLTDAQWVYHFFDKNNLSDEEIAKIDEHTDQTLSNKGLSLPDNVFIIGTVNMDDTTHQFSRKVIDRAMTIEMNGGNLEDMFGGSNDLKYPTEADDDILSMDDLRAKYVNADEVLEKCERVKDNEAALRFITGKDFDGNLVPEDENTLPKKLNAINNALEGTPYQVSYRVFNELVIYLAVLLDKKENADKELEELADQALDQITLMKILPRVEGDADMFMLNHSETIDDKEVKNKLEWLKAIMPEGASSKKLKEMIDRLDKTEFTRFWP